MMRRLAAIFAKGFYEGFYREMGQPGFWLIAGGLMLWCVAFRIWAWCF